VGCWHGCLSGAGCSFVYGRADAADAHCVLLQEIQIGFSFIFPVPAHPGSPGQNPESRKMVVVVVVPRSNSTQTGVETVYWDTHRQWSHLK